MKKIVLAILLLLSVSATFADQQLVNFSGQYYLNLFYKQRVEAITSFIEHGKDRGITISKGPVFYCRKLDTFYAKHPDFAKETLFVTLKTLIIMEYDWNKKGLDKDLLARKWLGEELYQTNKFRLGIETHKGT